MLPEAGAAAASAASATIVRLCEAASVEAGIPWNESAKIQFKFLRTAVPAETDLALR